MSNDWKQKSFNEGKEVAEGYIKMFTEAMKVNKERYTKLLENEALGKINWYKQLRLAGQYARKDKVYYKSCGEACVYVDYLNNTNCALK